VIRAPAHAGDKLNGLTLDQLVGHINESLLGAFGFGITVVRDELRGRLFYVFVNKVSQRVGMVGFWAQRRRSARGCR